MPDPEGVLSYKCREVRKTNKPLDCYRKSEGGDNKTTEKMKKKELTSTEMGIYQKGLRINIRGAGDRQSHNGGILPHYSG